jgi:hypothetical protein
LPRKGIGSEHTIEPSPMQPVLCPGCVQDATHRRSADTKLSPIRVVMPSASI